MSCNNNNKVADEDNKNEVHLVTLDPGHFHAALVQKYMYADVDSVVNVFAPEGDDVKLHLARIEAYNNREQDPTHWIEKVHTGKDFLDQMFASKKTGTDAGINVVVLAGNNEKKTEYILRSLQNGFNVLGDKPMAIDSAGFKRLQESFDLASKNSLLLYDIMTERFEITSILLREISMMPGIFGTLQKGTEKDPAVVKNGVHYLYKYVSGNVLTRPPWFFDVLQEGEGIVDVMTHLVDLAQWECFPDESIDFTKDVKVNNAKHWPTDVSLAAFKEITKSESFPSYLKDHVVSDTLLKYYCNGEINYELKGVHVKTVLVWNYKAGEGMGDSYEALMRGTKANLVIRQGADQNYESTIYIEPAGSDSSYEKNLFENFKTIQEKHPGVELKKLTKGWEIVIPKNYKEGHEEHFARVTKQFLDYLRNKNMPAWEVPGMLAKYYTTTKALELANKVNEK
ncbi:MAG: putative oxidoreductase C-terminal domain-containing protein [Ginsengibacter sp.]